MHDLQVTSAAISDCFSEEALYRSLKYLISLFTTRLLSWQQEEPSHETQRSTEE